MALEGKEEVTPSQLLPPLASEGVGGLVVCTVCFFCWHLRGVKASGVNAVVSQERTQGVPSPFAFVFSFQEDHYALLVKAWETKVFPTIRRRFRNEAERKSGLDQIKGALQLGLVLYVFLWIPLHGLKRCVYMKLRE